jgi:hypothetical protein
MRRCAAGRLASAQIRRLPDRTIAEALGRLPGIVTLATSLEGAMGRVDHAGRATGDFVAMRGLPGLRETRIDGIEIPQSLPYSRGTQLGLMALAPDMALKVHRVLDARLAGRRSPARWISITSGRLPPRRRGLRLGLTAGADDQAWLWPERGNMGRQCRVRLAERRWAAGAGGQRGAEPAAFRQRRADLPVRQPGLCADRCQGRSAPGLDPAANLLLASVNAQDARHGARGNRVVALGWRASDRLTVTASAMWASRAIAQDVYQVSVQGGRAAGFFAQTTRPDGLVRTQSIRADAHYWFETNPARPAGHGPGAAVWDAGRDQGAGPRVCRAGPHRPAGPYRDFVLGRGYHAAFRRGQRGQMCAAFPCSSSPRRCRAGRQSARLSGAQPGERESETSRTAGWAGTGGCGWKPAPAGMARSAAWRCDRGARRDGALSLCRYPARGHHAGRQRAGRWADRAGAARVYDYAIPTISDAALLRAIGRAAMQPRTIDDSNANAYALHEDRLAAYAMVTRHLGGMTMREAMRGRARSDLSLGLRGEWSGVSGRYWLAGNDGVPADGVAYGWNHLSAHYAALLPSVTLHWRPDRQWTFDAALWTS